MAYKVVVTARFKRHLRDIGDYIAAENPGLARRWIGELEGKVLKLSSFPEAYPLAREYESHAVELRQMLFGRGRNKYRIIFTIRGSEVVVLDVRHGARDELPPGSLGGV